MCEEVQIQPDKFLDRSVPVHLKTFTAAAVNQGTHFYVCISCTAFTRTISCTFFHSLTGPATYICLFIHTDQHDQGANITYNREGALYTYDNYMCYSCTTENTNLHNCERLNTDPLQQR